MIEFIKQVLPSCMASTPIDKFFLAQVILVPGVFLVSSLKLLFPSATARHLDLCSFNAPFGIL